MRIRRLLILLLLFVFTAALTYVVFFGVTSGPYTFLPTSGLVSSVELNGGTVISVKVKPVDAKGNDDPDAEVTDELMDEVMKMFKERLDDRGFYDISLSRAEDDIVRIEMYTDDYEDLSDSNDLTKYICERGVLKFYDEEGNYIIDNAAILDGTAREVRYDDTTYMLYFRLTEDGAEAFNRVRDEFGKDSNIDIEYDGTKLVTRKLSSIIKDGQFASSLGFTRREVTSMAYQLNSGILDAKFTVSQARSIKSVMGSEVFGLLMAGVLITLLAFITVMFVRYASYGFITVLHVWMFSVLLVFALAAVRLKLSPAGIAGTLIGLSAFMIQTDIILCEVRKLARANGKEPIRDAYRNRGLFIVDINAALLLMGIVMAVFEKSPMGEFSSAVALSALIGFLFNFVFLRGFLHLFKGAFPNSRIGFTLRSNEIADAGRKEV